MANYVICGNASVPYIAAYAFSASGWGAKYATPAVPPGSSAISVDTSPDNATVYSSLGNSAWAWTVASGFGTKYTSASGSLGFARGVKRIASNVFFSGDGTPFIRAHPWSNSTGFGTAYSNPVTLPPNAASSPYNNLGGTSTAVAVTSGQSPFVNVYAWSASGFGTRYASFSGISGTGTRAVHLNDQYMSIAHGSSPFTHVYQWSDSTGVGTKYANPGVLMNGGSYSVEMAISKTAVGFASIGSIGGRVYAWSSLGFGTSTASTSGTNTNGFAFAKEEDAVFFGRNTSPFLFAYPFTIAGIGSVFTSPSPTPGSVAYTVATSYPASNAYSMTADVVSFALTGIASGLKTARTVTADTRSFALTGVAAGLTIGRKVTASQGAFTLAGSDATLTKSTAAGYTLAASVGSFSLAGQPIGLPLGRKITAAQGAFSLAGIDLVLRSTRIMAASYGTYGLTGIAIRLVTTRIVTASTRSFTLTGINNRLFISRKIIATSNAFLLTGNQANLITSASRSILAAAGQFVLSGISSTLSKGSRALGSVGVFTVTRRPAGLVSTRIIVSGPGSFSLSGESSTLAFGRKLPISSRQFAVSGIASDLFRTRSLYATPRQFLLTGSTTYLRIVHPPIICQAGTFTLPYLATSLRYSNPKVSQLPPRLEFQSSGKNVNLKPSRAIIGTMSFAMEQTACALRWHRV